MGEDFWVIRGALAAKGHEGTSGVRKMYIDWVVAICTHLSKLVDLYTENEWTLSNVNYTSIK